MPIKTKFVVREGATQIADEGEKTGGDADNG
jgi:hypothetical protein